MDPDKQIQLIQKIDQLIGVLENGQAASQASPAAQVILAIVPLVSIIFGTTLLFFFLLWNFRLKNELIKTGQYIHTTVQYLRLLTLLLGILSTAVGVPMTILFIAIEGMTYIVLGGVIPMFAGIGLLLFFIFSRNLQNNTNPKKKAKR